MSDDMKQDPIQPPVPPRAAPGMRGWVRALLVVSLALNLLVFGLVIGARGIGDRFDGPDRRGPEHAQKDRRGEEKLDPAFGPLGRALPSEYRRAIGQELRARGRPSDENRQMVAQELGAMIEALRAEPFDSAALAKVMEAQSTRFAKRNTLGRAILIEHLEGMSGEARAQYADRLEKGFRRAVERARP